MKFQFVEKRVDISEDLREYTRKKVGKLDKYFKREGEAQVTFSREGSRMTAEITVVSENLTLRVHVVSDDMYGAIDSCVAGMERQIHKNKTRLAKRLHKNAFAREVPPTFDEPVVDEEVEFPIIRSKRFSVKPMTPEEAILQMNLLGHQFFVFKDFDDKESFSVVYKRNDGGYGLIQSQ
ncbi:MAG: ribosome-associated translation inhibitor RaiA [Oscillospiraceae bacterium]|nr:ribosome-associated translation inhibitor RaiA [Oscillospiraceae bacterium]